MSRREDRLKSRLAPVGDRLMSENSDLQNAATSCDDALSRRKLREEGEKSVFHRIYSSAWQPPEVFTVSLSLLGDFESAAL